MLALGDIYRTPLRFIEAMFSRQVRRQAKSSAMQIKNNPRARSCDPPPVHHSAMTSTLPS